MLNLTGNVDPFIDNPTVIVIADMKFTRKCYLFLFCIQAMVVIILIRKHWRGLSMEEVSLARIVKEVEAKADSKRASDVRRTPTITDIFDDHSVNSEKKADRTTEISETYPKTQQNKEFIGNWCRIQNARTNWQSLLMPCINNTVWGENILEDVAVEPTDGFKSFISIWDLQPAGRFSRFFIQSVSRASEEKTIGGDSWRVHLRGPGVVVPTVFDLNKGVYEVLFLIIEPGRYRAEIYLDYTLCNGLKDPPSYWFKSGKYNKTNRGHHQ